MSRRTAKFVSAVFASFLLGAPLSTLSPSAVRAADDCLAGPKKDQTPPGGHWYYRIDHATKRNCWYLGDEREKPSQAAAPKRLQSAQPDSPKADTIMQPSIADAHAELAPQARIDAPNRDNALAAAMPVKPAIGENSDIPGTETGRSIVASRWPDSSAAILSAPSDPALSASSDPALSASSDPAPNNRDAVASANSTPQAQPATPVVGQLAAADASSETPTYSVPLQLAAALMAALALACIVASIIFRFGPTRRPAPAKIRQHGGANWEATDDDRIVLSAPPEADVLPRRRGFARDVDQAGNRGERTSEFFALLSKRT